MSELFGNHIVGFPTRRLIFLDDCNAAYLSLNPNLNCCGTEVKLYGYHNTASPENIVIMKTYPCNIQRFFFQMKKLKISLDFFFIFFLLLLKTLIVGTR